MSLKKRWVPILMVITALVLLAACGSKEEAGGTNGDNPRNHTTEDYMSLSEGFEEYPVWIETEDEPTRDSNIDNIYVFEKGKVNMYNLGGSNTIEDILELSDDELIKLARETSNEQYINSENEIKEDKFYNPEIISEAQKEFQYAIGADGTEAYFKEQTPMTEAIYFNVEGEIPEQSPTKYTLDIKIDELGQNTETIDLIMPNVTSELVNDNSDTGVFGDYVDFLYLSPEALELKESDERLFDEEKANYIDELKKLGSFVEKDGYELYHPQNFVPNPYVWKKEDKELSIDGVSFSQKIFDTNFSGIKTGKGSLLTRVDDSFVGFKLDSPDTDKKNVTIEGK